MKKKNKIEKALNNSFINYFSDLFVAVMVIAWIVVVIIMIAMAIYATIALGDVYMWSTVADLVAVPLTAGGAIWMVKNSVQHAIANSQGRQAHMDFPKIPDAEFDGKEEVEKSEEAEESEEAG